MATEYVQVPPDSSGKLVEMMLPVASSAGRQVMVTGAGASTAIATVTSSAGLQVQLTTDGLGKVIPVTSSGVNLYTTQGINVAVMGSSGASAVVTSSGGLAATIVAPVTLSSVGITQIIPVTSSGVNLYTTQGINVMVAGSSGAPTPVTSSGGALGTHYLIGATGQAVNVSTGGAIHVISGTTATLANISSSALAVYLSSAIRVAQVATTDTAAFVLPYSYVSSSSGNTNNVTSSAGYFAGFYAFNTGTTIQYLKVFNASSSPLLGTTGLGFPTTSVPGMVFGIPASTGTGGAGSQHILTFPVYSSRGLGFNIGVSPVTTSTVSSINAGDILLTIYYV